VTVGVQTGDEAELELDGEEPAPPFVGVARTPQAFARVGLPPDEVQRLQAIVARHPRAPLGVKRAVDMVLAAVGLLLSAPLLAVLGLLIRLDSGGPAFFRQLRTGRRMRLFWLTKLRTMHDDGRVTRVGRLLRPTGLDELPQLWNVLKGDMSLVGPRPEEPHLVVRYDREVPGYAARHFMRPGITGWAQVNGMRGRVSIAERLYFDLRYLHGWTLALDLRIFVRTVATVWRDTRQAWRS
jgi:lipopolysaccharide/colanic/teichoic acid biosynthesis glycosyltransferase